MNAVRSFFESIALNLSSTEKIFFGLMAAGAVLMFIGFVIWLLPSIGDGEGKIKKRLSQFVTIIGVISFGIGTMIFMKDILS